MKKIVVMIAIAVVLVIVATNGAAPASAALTVNPTCGGPDCPCPTEEPTTPPPIDPCDLPQLGSGTSNVGGGRINNLVNTSMAVLDGTCYVMYAGGGEPREALAQWRLFVKKTTPDGNWVLTGGGQPLNYNPEKVTNPYFYEMQLVVFQSRLYAVFAETDGDGDSNGNGHKVIRVKRYDENTNTWEFVDFDSRKPDRNPQLGLSRDFWPGPYVRHWSYLNPNILATDDALYVAWTEYSPENGAANGLSVIKKYSKQPGTETYAWATLSTTGLPPTRSEPNKAGMFEGSLTLGEYQGQLVLSYDTYVIRNDAPQVSLRVAMYDEANKTWTSLSKSWENNDENTTASGGILVEHNNQLYVLWGESTYQPGALNNPPYRLFVKRYDGIDPETGKHKWTLIGGGPVRSSPSVTNPLLLSDDDGLTVVSWDANELFVDRFNGTAWQTIGTTGAGNVVAPYMYYMYAPSISAASSDGRIYLNWHANDGNPGLLLSAYID